MALTQVEKVRAISYIKKHRLGDLYYGDMCDFLNTKNKITKSDFISFFTDYLLKNLKSTDSSSALSTKLAEIINSIIQLAKYKNEDVESSIIDKVRTIKIAYENYLINITNENDQENIELTNSINKLLDKVNELYPLVDTSAALSGYINTIADYEHQIKVLKTELENLAKLNESLEKRTHSQNRALSEKRRTISKMSKDATTVQNKIEAEKREKERLKGQIKKLSDKIAALEKDIENITRTKDNLSQEKARLREELAAAQKEIERLLEVISQKDSIIDDYQTKERKRFLEIQEETNIGILNENIKKLIIEVIYKGNATIGDIICHLNNQGYSLTRREIKEYLAEIRKTINVVVRDESFTEYEIEKTSILTDQTYDIPLIPGTRCCDMLVVSDFHLSDLDTTTLKDLEMINEYCNKNGIGIVLNGGDFFSFKSYKKSKRHIGLANWQQLVEKTILKYPYDKNIIHLVLGGNHDRESISGGIDAIKALSTEREDFTYLGYTSARITFNGSVSSLNSLGIHHPNTRYEEFVGSLNYSTEQLLSTINSYYTRNGETRNTYLDLVGHIHKSNLDTDNGICVIPSYMKDRIINGAWHLKVYFDELGNIQNVVLMPLIKTTSLQKVTEISYEKKLIKEK